VFLAGLVVCATGGTACKKKDDKNNKPKATKGNPKGKDTTKTGTGTGGLVEAGSKDVARVDLGSLTSCALFKDGAVRCWGGNIEGALGVGRTEDQVLESYTPRDVTGVNGASKLWLTSSYCWGGGYSEGTTDTACVEDKAGATQCWGHNSYTYGDGSSKASDKPIADAALKGAVDFDAHCGTACAVNADKTVSCWGSGVFGQLGNGTNDRTAKTPVKVKDLANATEVGCGQNHCCARTADGKVSCWGYLREKTNVPKVVPKMDNITSLAVMENGVCGLDKAGVVHCWDGYKDAKPLKGGDGIIQIDAEDRIGCGVKKDKTVVCWGRNTWGQLGDGSKKDSPWKAVAVKGLTGVVQVATGADHACALTGDNKVMCWGKNSRGQLGDASNTDRAAPVEVKGLTAKHVPEPVDTPAALPTDKKVYKPAGTPPKGCAKQTAMIVHVNGKPRQFVVRNAEVGADWFPKIDGAKGYKFTMRNYDPPEKAKWAMARGEQLRVRFGISHWVIEKKDGHERPVAKPLDAKGEYKPGWKEAYRIGNSAGIYDNHKHHGFDTGSVKLTHLDKNWVCGEVDLSNKKTKTALKGAFAFPVPAKK